MLAHLRASTRQIKQLAFYDAVSELPNREKLKTGANIDRLVDGLTCWVDALGGMHDVYFDNTPNVYGPGFKTVSAPLLAAGEKRALTFYTRHGDVFGWTCFALTSLWTAACGWW